MLNEFAFDSLWCECEQIYVLTTWVIQDHIVIAPVGHSGIFLSNLIAKGEQRKKRQECGRVRCKKWQKEDRKREGEGCEYNIQKQEREKVNHLKQIMSLCSVCIHSLRKDPVFVENFITIKIKRNSLITGKKKKYWHYTQMWIKFT